MIRRKSYPSDVSDEEWSLVAPYLALMREDASQRDHSLRELFNGLRYLIRYGIAWRAMPNDLPPWFSVYQQARRWLAAGVFETLAQDLRAVLRLAAGRHEEPTAAIIDSRTLRSTPESGPRAGYDGAKRKRGSKLHMAVDTLGHLLALHVTPANVDDRAEVGKLADAVQEARSSRKRTRNRTVRGQTRRGQEGVRPAAKTLGRRTILRLDDQMPKTGQRLRALRRHSRRLPRSRLRLHHAQTSR